MFRFLDCLINAVFRAVCLNWDPDGASTLQVFMWLSLSVFTLYDAWQCLSPRLAIYLLKNLVTVSVVFPMG